MDDLERQVKETEALVRKRKEQVARAVLAGHGESTAELAAISTLEVKLANLRSLFRARELTRTD